MWQDLSLLNLLAIDKAETEIARTHSGLLLSGLLIMVKGREPKEATHKGELTWQRSQMRLLTKTPHHPVGCHDLGATKLAQCNFLGFVAVRLSPREPRKRYGRCDINMLDD